MRKDAQISLGGARWIECHPWPGEFLGWGQEWVLGYVLWLEALAFSGREGERVGLNTDIEKSTYDVRRSLIRGRLVRFAEGPLGRCSAAPAGAGGHQKNCGVGKNRTLPHTGPVFALPARAFSFFL